VLGDNSVQWNEPGTGAHVQVDTIPWLVADPVEHWRRFRAEVERRRTLPGFRLIRIGAGFPMRGWLAADVEYSWQARRGRLRATLPIRRVVEPAEIAALAIELMSNTAVTGATFDIDGGQQLVEV